MDKMQALENAMKQIEKDFGKGSIMRLGEATANMNIEVIPSGILPLDIALGVGGVPRGRIIEVYGPESSGKTTVTLHMIAEAQKMGGIAAFIDAEHALDPVYAHKLATIVMIPAMAQYTPNQISLPFFTILIIHLQAIHPETKAARKPTASDAVLMPALTAEASFIIFIPSSKASPRIGGITIRKEN